MSNAPRVYQLPPVIRPAPLPPLAPMWPDARRLRKGGGHTAEEGGGEEPAPDYPAVALRLIDGEWFVDDENVTTPDGYVDGDLMIDDGATSGLTLTVVDGAVFAETP